MPNLLQRTEEVIQRAAAHSIQVKKLELCPALTRAHRSLGNSQSPNEFNIVNNLLLVEKANPKPHAHQSY